MATKPAHEKTAGSREESSEFVKNFEKVKMPATLYTPANQKPFVMI